MRGGTTLDALIDWFVRTFFTNTLEIRMDTKDFLTLIWPRGIEPGVLTLWDLSTKQSSHFSNIDTFVEAARAIDDSPNGQAFFGVASRRPGLSPGEQGSGSQLVALPGLFLDVDFGRSGHSSQRLPPDESSALSLFYESANALKCGAPDLVINSGNGLHIYYLFSDPIFVRSPTERAIAKHRLRNFQKGFIDFFAKKDFHLDDTATLTRVLRVVGTHNKKGSLRKAVHSVSAPFKNAFEIEDQELGPHNMKGSLRKDSVSAPFKNAFEIEDQESRQNPPLSFAKLKDRCKTLSNLENRELARRVLEGESLCERGERNTTLQKVAGVIAFASMRDYPDIQAEQLAEFFRPSLTVWANEEEATKSVDEEIAIVTKMLQAHLEEGKEKKEAEQKIKDSISKSILKNNKTTQTCATPPEKQLIILRGYNCFIFNIASNTYEGPLNILENFLEIRRIFADNPLVDLFRTTEKKRVPKTQNQILEDYASVAYDLVYDATVEHTYFDTTKRVLHVACARKRDLTPKYDSQVDHWLGLMGGTYASKLQDWLASITALDKQCCALYLFGEPGTGKTLLATGVAKIWKEDGAPTALENIVGNFNQDLLSCPLVVADEQLPKDIQSGTLRSLIGRSSFTITKKHVTNASYIGAIRMIVTSNNTSLLRQDEHLSAMDMRAISERFLFLVPSIAAREYLRSIDTSSWIAGDVLPRHILWLCKNRQVLPGKRFLVEGEETKMHRAIISNMYVPSLMLQLITRILTYPADTFLKRSPGILVGDNEVLISPSHVVDIWDTVFPRRKDPTLNQIAEGLEAMSSGRKMVGNIDYMIMRLDYILEASEKHMLYHLAKERIEGPKKYHLRSNLNKTPLTVISGGTTPGTENKS